LSLGSTSVGSGLYSILFWWFLNLDDIFYISVFDLSGFGCSSS